MDFYHVDCAITLKRIYVFFALGVGSRYVHILGATSHPTGLWTTQQARNLLTDLDEHAAAISVPRPRPRRPVHHLVRRRSRRSRDRHHEDPTALPEGELLRRTLRPHRQNRAHRPPPDLRRTPSTDRPRPARRPLQRPQATSSTAASPATPRSSRPGFRPPADQAPASTRRADQRVRPCRLEPQVTDLAEFWNPTGGPGGKLDQVAGEDPCPVQFRAPSRWSRRLRSQPVSDLPLPAEPASTVCNRQLCAQPNQPARRSCCSHCCLGAGPVLRPEIAMGKLWKEYVETHEEASKGRRSERVR